jgi:hypothetical protein
LQNKRNKNATEVGLSVKKLKVSIGNGLDDLHEPRKQTALNAIRDVKGEKIQREVGSECFAAS